MASSLDQKIHEVQKILAQQHIDGWLLYDFRHSNRLACDFLGISPETMLTRRYCYWIPQKGDPVSIVHNVEPHVLAHTPGKKLPYSAWKLFEAHLKEILKGKKVIAMEYSPRCAIPTASRVDGGILDLVREQGVKVVSSASFLQHFTCVWTKDQYNLHKEAADVLDKAAASAWALVTDHLKKNKPLNEYDVQQYILNEMHKHKCIMDGAPICGVNQNSANPHYNPTKEKSSPIKKGDFVLIDLWCKRDLPESVYADITRVAVAGTATERHQEIFHLVRKAQKAGTDFVQERVEKKKEVKGYEVDNACRQVIIDAGYGEYFTHRTGHNIHTEDHGPGANIDGFETLDERVLLPKTCFSIEPGVYLPKEFGVRLEYDVYIHENHTIEVTGGIEDELVELF
ncbi:MAG TPA: M24 family metallopeptidase [Rhabdochlamydiaceae bacterium]|nr:M24 family metallopeptidase [Rhabdochlamydiaceae bacterium]